MTRSSLPVILIALIVAIIVLATFAYMVVSTASDSRYEIPVLSDIPDFEFTNYDGQPFGLKDMEGKICIVDFMFTRCKGPCPIMVSKFSEIYQLYAGTDLVQLISITVDPEYDSLSVLKEYAEQQGVNDSRWAFLWAPIEDVINLSEKGFMIAAEKEALPGGHSVRFILVDSQGRIRSYHDSLDDKSVRKLKRNIKNLVDEII